MGVDLSLLPFDAEHPGLAFSHSILQLERRRELWPLIEAMELDIVPNGFTSFLGRQANGEHGYGETIKTPYGTPLKYTRVGKLVSIAHHDAVRDNPKNRAVWAYLMELPIDTKVALYWGRNFKRPAQWKCRKKARSQMAATDFDYEMAMALRRSHCDRKGKEHECVGEVTIKRGCVYTDCQLCGKGQQFPGWDSRVADMLRVVFNSAGIDWDRLELDAKVDSIRSFNEQDNLRQ